MKKTNCKTYELKKGIVREYDFDKVTLYAYQTNDFLNNEVFVVAKEGRGVCIELPCFYENIEEFSRFLKDGGINVEAKLVSYHAAGASFLSEVKTYGTESSQLYNTVGGGAALVGNFKGAFGEIFDSGMADVDVIISDGEIDIAGIKFVIKSNADAYEVEIPEINSVYIHMLGHDCHSIIAGVEHADAVISQLKDYIDRGFDLILTSHYTPEDVKDAQTKILYIERIKEIAKSSESAEEMKEKVISEFAQYSGQNYLDMTVGMFFPEIR